MLTDYGLDGSVSKYVVWTDGLEGKNKQMY